MVRTLTLSDQDRQALEVELMQEILKHRRERVVFTRYFAELEQENAALKAQLAERTQARAREEGKDDG